MNKQEVLEKIKEIGIVPVLRADSADEAMQLAEAIIAGGINCLEITMTVPNAVEVIEKTAAKYGNDVLIGAGTVLDVETARRCVEAGAKFIVTPCLIPEIIDYCKETGILICAGSLTPTEVFTAWSAGADVIKVFPASAMGGSGYIKALKAPFPKIELMPTGGVSLETIGDFFRAGVIGVGVGGELVNLKDLREGRAENISESARKYVEIIKTIRSHH